jgi:conjugal transfer pilus assembly protein TraV
MIAQAIRASWVIVAVCVIAACSGVGEKKFSCPGRPNGVRCMSATEVYRATENTDIVEPTADHPLGDDPESPAPKKARQKRDSRHGGRAAAGNPDEGSPREQTRAAFPAVDKPVPIRVPARDMRVWFAPWQDAAGVLHLGGYAIVELEGPRWIWGDSLNAIEPARFFSLQESASELKGAVGKDQGASNVRAGTSERSKTTPSTLSNQGAPR